MKKQIEELIKIKEDINIEEEWETWWSRVKPDEYEESFKSAVKNAYYSGAGNMGFIMSQLAKQKETNGGAIVDSLFNEINDYFTNLVDSIEAALKR